MSALTIEGLKEILNEAAGDDELADIETPRELLTKVNGSLAA